MAGIIQHNIPAMNAYANYAANTKALSSNLEKLSSAYKINRAGDDAAGLAISEKMRAQISGLETAQKNAKDGISLVQTAEGALTEVHSMLNRMVTLAEQSANGTYSNEVDREQIQKEIKQLSDEIDRIADSSNFNGIKLLDGSMSVKGVEATLSTNVDSAKTVETSNTYTSGAYAIGTTGAAEGGKMTYTVAWTAEDGTQYSKTVNLTMKSGSTLNSELDTTDYTSADIYLQADDGTVYTPSTSIQAGGNLALADTEKALLSELQKDEKLTDSFNVEFGSAAVASTGYAANTIRFTAKTGGADGAVITAQQMSQVDTAGAATDYFVSTAAATASTTYTTYNGKNVEQSLDLSNVGVLKGDGATVGAYTSEALAKSVFDVNGSKFVIVGNAASAAGLQNLNAALARDGYDDVNIIVDNGGALVGNNDGNTVKFSHVAANVTDATTVASEISRVTGMNFSAVTANTLAEYQGSDGNGAAANASAAVGQIYYDGDVTLTNVDTKTDGRLTLQIGDTAEDFNKLKVEINDIHVASLGIGDIDCSTQEGAAEAMDKIKNAINYVSDVRGTLGATQNRLDHTINNLTAMQTNIQDAESTIRDTDVASMMMEYTKNNIKVQAAQAMLAQANQLPQGVLQMLG